MESLQIDHVRGLYCDVHAGFTATVDFLTVRATANALAGHVGMPSLAVTEAEVGSAAAFEKYQRLQRLAIAKMRPGEVWYDPRTPREAKVALDSARATRRQIRLHYGDPRTGLDRLAIDDVVGFVGYAGWQLPHPILLADRHVHLGPRICELEVVRVVDVEAMVATYNHPSYRLPEFSTARLDASSERVTLLADGNPVVECTNQAQATRWTKFFKGSTHAAPKIAM